MLTSPALDHSRLMELRANTRYSGLRTAIYALRWFSFLTGGAALIFMIKDVLPMLRYTGGFSLGNLMFMTSPVYGVLAAYVVTGLMEAHLDRIDAALQSELTGAE